jgi:hypothetical protein
VTRWVRDLNSIGKRERMAVNLASLIVGVAIILIVDSLSGLSFGRSIFNIGVVLIVGVAMSMTYNILMKRQYLKDRQIVLP